MAITLDHTIIPSSEKDAAARFIAHIFDLPYDGPGHFAPVRVNDALTLDFGDGDSPIGQLHYAFVVSEDDFDQIFDRIKADPGTTWGSGPFSPDDNEINHRRGGRGLYFRGGPDRHLWEIMTTPETGT